MPLGIAIAMQKAHSTFEVGNNTYFAHNFEQTPPSPEGTGTGLLDIRERLQVLFPASNFLEAKRKAVRIVLRVRRNHYLVKMPSVNEITILSSLVPVNLAQPLW